MTHFLKTIRPILGVPPMQNTQRLRKSDKVFYGLGRLGSTTLLSVFSLATYYLYDKVYSVDPVLNGIANALGKLSIAVSSFVMGYISDRTIHPRLGRRKPFILSGSIFLAISFVMLYIPELLIDTSAMFTLFIWEAIWASGFNFFYGYLLTPYQAWLPEITMPDERVEVSGYENLFNLIGNIIGMGGSFALPFIIMYKREIWYELIIVLSIVEILCYLPAYLRIREPEVYIKQPNIIQELRIVISNRHYILWIFSRGILSVGVIMVTTLIMKFLEQYLQFMGIQYLTVALGVMVVIMVFFFIWQIISKKYRVKKSMYFSLGILGISLMLLYTLDFLSPPLKQTAGLFLLVLGAIGLSGYWLFNYVILANIIEGDTLITGESRAGIYTGFDGIILNIWQATAYVITGYVDKIYPVSTSALWGLVAGISVIVGLLIFRYVDPEPHLTIKGKTS